MIKEICNCMVCAEEFDPNTFQSEALSVINATHFKVCQSCLDSSDPAEDYRQVRNVVNSYLKLSTAKNLFIEVHSILESRAKK